MTYPSPRTPGSTPNYDWEYSRMSSATPTPSPRPNWLDSTPRRPATRAAHSRVNSYSQPSAFSPRPPRDSPRYNSSGEYATVDVSPKHFSSSSSRRPSGSYPRPSKRDRSHSYTYVRSSTPYGESDEDEIIDAMGRIYVLPAQSRSKGRRHAHYPQDHHAGVWYTDHHGYPQGASYDPAYANYQSPQQSYYPPPARAPTSHSHVRRSSTSVPQRPSTVRPTANTKERVKLPPPRGATESDAKHHQIPKGYSLKNWDPNEEPILLLGSVFDANSLGKWIFDWTVYRMGAQHPISDMAGELWLLLIQLYGDLRKAEDVHGRVRCEENREIVAEFIDAGERLTDKFLSLLKLCESPMLKAAKKKGGLGKNSGVEFVDTLFGRDRELERTEKFMQNVRLYKLRFEANCRDIVKNPNQ